MAGTMYQNAPICVECGNTPLFVKWVAKRIAQWTFWTDSDIFRCPYRRG